MDQSVRLNKQTPQETFDDFTAIGIAEGFLEVKSEKEKLDAWQHLVNTGLVWSLQGWFGRTARRLILEGKIKAKD